MLKNKELTDLCKKYEFIYLDYLENFESIDYFAICWNTRVRKIEHILNVGKMLIYREQYLN